MVIETRPPQRKLTTCLQVILSNNEHLWRNHTLVYQKQESYTIFLKCSYSDSPQGHSESYWYQYALGASHTQFVCSRVATCDYIHIVCTCDCNIYSEFIHTYMYYAALYIYREKLICYQLGFVKWLADVSTECSGCIELEKGGYESHMH